MIPIIKYKFVYLGIAAILVLASVVALITYGLNLGIDFTGGTLWQIQFPETASIESVREVFHTDLESPEAVVIRNDVDGSYNVHLKEINEEMHQDLSQKLDDRLGPIEERSFQSISGVVGGELVKKAGWAVLINLFAIVLYVAYAFRKVSYPVKSWKYSIATLVALFHDALIPLGIFAVLGVFAGVEIDTNFIVATLMVTGFSVHDTIVVFDRIRENLRIRSSRKESFSKIVNDSINETMARSINTSLTLLVVLAAIFVLGVPTLNYFILVILIGTILGTYSSIFVASPLLTLLQSKKK
ncbi:MAG: protein translocase subunit SecF [Candidatus Harrisonbacteria bacterium CG10_big_fil_rev_8_21_14_0_10_44_23]|uniref:Protein-export membrane protein SecF n=1 Tax=Candidatus Harrisonbacteria bacterium CG10_big_fil_rev_8_21_14_0_10_44_23 TaxID=1974585 RepID=A0A2H0UPW2_9BACT|nr:MAG: protein translocase subunit SecF [Candidatus Harrisonbacteria bacterium CG10_big_fil_rev_8_21_14_0_10_44_23]